MSPTQIDFTKEWPMSDVVLITQNSQPAALHTGEDTENKETNATEVEVKDEDPQAVALHASKAYLAVHSPYFQAMFFGKFKEEQAREVELKGEEFHIVHLALQILHQAERQGPGGPSQDYTPEQLAQLYEFADRCDVPLIRDLCKNQLEKSKVKEALEVAVKLELHDSKLVESLDKATLQDYLATNTSESTFSVADVNVLLEKMNKIVTLSSSRLCNCYGANYKLLYQSSSGRCPEGSLHDTTDSQDLYK